MRLFIGTLASQMWKTPCHQFNYVQPEERVRWVQEWSKGLKVLTKTDLINSTKTGGTSVSVNNHVQMKQSGTAPPGCSNWSDCGLKLRSQGAMLCRHRSSQDYGFSYQVLNRANTGPTELIHAQNVRWQCARDAEHGVHVQAVSVESPCRERAGCQTSVFLCQWSGTERWDPVQPVQFSPKPRNKTKWWHPKNRIWRNDFGPSDDVCSSGFVEERTKTRDFYNNNIHVLYVTYIQYLCLYRTFRSIASCLVFAWRCESFVWEVLLGA